MTQRQALDNMHSSTPCLCRPCLCAEDRIVVKVSSAGWLCHPDITPEELPQDKAHTCLMFLKAIPLPSESLGESPRRMNQTVSLLLHEALLGGGGGERHSLCLTLWTWYPHLNPKKGSKDFLQNHKGVEYTLLKHTRGGNNEHWHTQ